MKSVFLLLLLSICQFAVAGKVEDMESALALGDIERARAKVEAMYKDRKYVMGPEAANLSGYSQLVDIFSAVGEFNANSEKFERSRQLSDFSPVEFSYQALGSKTEGKKSFAVSKKTIVLLNLKLTDADRKMKSARATKSELEVAQAEQNRIAEEKRRAEFAERQAALQAAQEQRRQELQAQRLANEKETDARQKECGGDYGTPRVGMSLERAKYCVGDLRLKGQVNRSDGVVSTYWAGKVYLHVMNGKVVSWGDLR
ncbi:hypothetical protein [Hylemonella gracilis]|uniref:Uncharacterized protein n=1 Tax=Hylemonella gracilis ATCC 19624 TaxID=887062 RepID=F3KWE7_9BURK|nr:hypothetical protein [Hylemonella gracilis]EGI75896.1 hypothetical protein HGR_13929 [Hylemonella gracilis ATCC 19624]